MQQNNFNVSTSDVLRLTVATYCRNQVGLNIVYFQMFGPSAMCVMTDIATALDVSLATAYKAFIGQDAIYYGSSWQSITNFAFAPYQQTINQGMGVTIGPSLPTQVTGLVSKYANLRGRHYRGRSYLPFIHEVFDSGLGNITAPGIAAMTGIANLILAPWPFLSSVDSLTGTLNPICYDIKLGTNFGVLTNFSVRPKFATQRRRGDQGRTNPLPW